MASYTLDLDQPKRNVFVTQLRDHEEDEDSSRLNRYPIVEESSSQLMSTGIRTLQSTLLIKENSDATKTQNELENKRAAFRKQMAACKTKEEKLAKRQQEITQKVNKFDKFIKETEMKRRRALEKYETEHKMMEQKSHELEIHKKELETLRQRHNQLQEKVQKYSIYEKYLTKVIEIIPDDYIDSSTDSMTTGIMMRFKTLNTTNEFLKDSLTTITDKIKHHQQIIQDIQQKYNQQLMINSNQLVTLQHQLESCIHGNAQLEHVLQNTKETYRNQSTIMGKTKLAVFNIAETCVRKHSQPLSNMTIDDMLTLIQEFMVRHEDICQMAQRLESPVMLNPSIKEVTESTDLHLVDSPEHVLQNKKKITKEMKLR